MKAWLIGSVLGLTASFISGNYFNETARERLAQKLTHAGTNEVIAALGQPDSHLDADTFNRRADEQARDNVPILDGDTTVHGEVWLYHKSGPSNIRYTTVEFDDSNHVANVLDTFWTKTP